MRLKEFDQQSQDPILSDSNLVKLIKHYTYPGYIDLIADLSPYNPASKYTAYKDLYTRVANSIKPLAAVKNPNIDLIVSTLERQIPFFRVPQGIRQGIEQQKQWDAEDGWSMTSTSPEWYAK